MKARRDEMLMADRDRFGQELAAWLSARGAAPKARPLTSCDFTIATKVGALSVTHMGDWVACRFQDVEAAKRHFGVQRIHQGRLNPYSGKWNFHYFVRVSWYEALDSFTSQLAPLLEEIEV